MEKGREKDLYMKDSVAFMERDMMMVIILGSIASRFDPCDELFSEKHLREQGAVEAAGGTGG